MKTLKILLLLAIVASTVSFTKPTPNDILVNKKRVSWVLAGRFNDGTNVWVWVDANDNTKVVYGSYTNCSTCVTAATGTFNPNNLNVTSFSFVASPHHAYTGLLSNP